MEPLLRESQTVQSRKEKAEKVLKDQAKEEQRNQKDQPQRFSALARVIT